MAEPTVPPTNPDPLALFATVGERLVTWPAFQQRGAVLTVAGMHLSSAVVLFTFDGTLLRAWVTNLSTPGVLLDAYLVQNQPDFLLELEDGRRLPAVLETMTWQAPAGRRCCFLLDAS